MNRSLFALPLFLALVSCHTESTHARTEPREVPTGSVRVSGPLLSYADVVDHVAPAVVTIHASRRVRAPQQYPFFEDPFFQQFFGGSRAPRSRQNYEVQHALGSGVIVRADGYILTNHHVVDGAEDIKVDVPSHSTYSAKVVGTDPPSDLAVLKLDAGNLPVLHLGDSDAVRVGDVCLAVGNPLGIGESVTAGIISAKGRSTDVVGGGSFQDFLQTDAPINQGNSGGALVNTRGDLIGINSQILSANGGNIGIGFAIPSKMAQKVMGQLIEKGKVRRGMLGVGIQQVTRDIASNLGLKEPHGVLVTSVTSGGPAEKAGVKPYDVITQVNGKNVDDANALRNEVASMDPGSDVTLTVMRNGSPQQMHARVGELTPEAVAQSNGGAGGAGKLGVSVVPLTPDLGSQLGIKRGVQGVVVQSVDPEGAAAQVGIEAGDVIQECNRQPVRSPADLQSALGKSDGRPALLLINRNGQTVTVAVPMG
jgi:Do/DeqQ family serine protease